MSVKVEELVSHAVEQLTKPDFNLAKALVEEDDRIDQWDVQIEEACLKILALHQPVAGDLRRITMVLKISNELERGGGFGSEYCGTCGGPDKGADPYVSGCTSTDDSSCRQDVESQY